MNEKKFKSRMTKIYHPFTHLKVQSEIKKCLILKTDARVT